MGQTSRAGTETKNLINGALIRTTGYGLYKPPDDPDWQPPRPQRLNALLLRTIGHQLSRPYGDGGWGLPSGRSRRLLTAPVFIFSTPRSGSTLLRVLLGSHSRLYAPPELPLDHLRVREETLWLGKALEGFELSRDDLDMMLWDRVLADLLARSGEPTLVAKTPANVLVWEEIARCWPDARFIFLLRHPAATAASQRELWDPKTWNADERGKGNTPEGKIARYGAAVQEARSALPGLTVRYEDLTSDPAAECERLCQFLGIDYEPRMVRYGRTEHGGFAIGGGDSSPKIRSGRVQPAAPVPERVPEELVPLCETWGYEVPGVTADNGTHGNQGTSH